jgi:predicted transcriptional regulator
MLVKLQDLMEEMNYSHVNINASLHEIRKLMHDENLNHLPLLDDKGNIFGVIGSMIIAESHETAVPEAAQNIWEICDRDFTVIHPDASIEETIDAMGETERGFIVVAIDGRYLGAITSEYLLSKIEVLHEDAKGADAMIKS